MQTYHFAQISTNLIFHPKLYKLSKILGVPKSQALGHLAAVWTWAVTYSPNGVIDPNDPTLDLHFACDGMLPITELLNALILSEFVENRRGILHLHDWSEHTGWHLRNRLQNKERQAKFRTKGKSSVTVTEDVTEGSNAGVTRDSNGPEKRDVTDILTKLNKAKQNKAELRRDVADGFSAVAEATAASPRKGSKKAGEEGTPGTQVWNAYCRAMQECWKLTPPRSAKTSSQAVQLVELVGLETALKLAAYYPTRRAEFYVKTGHPFGTLLTNYMEMLREINAGIKLTKGVVREIVSKEESENACKFDQVRKETNIGLMTDEEFAEWEKEQELLLAAKQNPMLQESTDGNECDTVF